jgi:DNA (cytosine-5)-methyltransferase 1
MVGCMPDPNVCAIDLFCGVGGLSHGLQEAGVPVVAGIDVDPACRYPFESNIDGAFLDLDIRKVTAAHLTRLWPEGCVRVLAGCAPCQPFSPHRRGKDTSAEGEWALLSEFERLVLETLPEIVTMENVPRVGSTEVFTQFVAALRDAGYHVSWRSCRGVDYGLPQSRRRLVLIASLLGTIEVPAGPLGGAAPRTVRDAIEDLPAIESGGSDPDDPLHASRGLSPINMKRMRASKPGGTWEDWPEDLRAPCHRRKSGATFRNVYARMEWDKPSPTITTLAHNFGTGRFGHPDQDRPISLREASLLQGFPRRYRFVRDGERVFFDRIGRLIGNAVPPPLGRAVGAAIVKHVTSQIAWPRLL